MGFSVHNWEKKKTIGKKIWMKSPLYLAPNANNYNSLINIAFFKFLQY